MASRKNLNKRAGAGGGYNYGQPKDDRLDYDDLFYEFEEYRKQWKTDTSFMSSSTDIHSHPAYQAIIKMGKVAVPFILGELEKGPNHWFHALHLITGENPIKKEDHGNMESMRTAWLEWGKQRRLKC